MSKLAKIPLLIEKKNPLSGGVHNSITHALPFFQKGPGRYVHRVRSGSHHTYSGEFSHLSFSFWCGGIGCIAPNERPRKGVRLGDKARLLASIPLDAVLCATCEGRAIGAGLAGAPFINGKPVRYSPR